METDQVRSSLVAIMLAAMLAAGCRESASPVAQCELGINCRPGLQVSPVDSASGALVAALRNARVEIFDGSYSEQLEAGPVAPGGVIILYWVGAVERPGTYAVRVSAAGFRTWQHGGIVVARGSGGHVQTVALVVPMQPAGQGAFLAEDRLTLPLRFVYTRISS
jgi:hypothetical protein